MLIFSAINFKYLKFFLTTQQKISIKYSSNEKLLIRRVKSQQSATDARHTMSHIHKFQQKLSILNNFRYFHAINIQFVPQHCEKKSSPQSVHKTPKTRRVQNTLTTMAVNIAYLCRIFTSVTEIN